MQLNRILVVEDDKLSRFALKDLLERKDYEVEEAVSAEDALGRYKPGGQLAVITDMKMPGRDGIALLESLRARDPDVAVIVITAYGTVETAVEAMKRGAVDYITKPFDGDELIMRLSRIEKIKGLQEENRRLRDQIHPPTGFHRIVGRSKVMEEIFSTIETVADSLATVLIEGESGTGKEVVAGTIHALSPRADGPFVAVSCAAIPESLLESELFGYEKHAFTGALKAKPGRFEMAHEGTLFLDDIDDTPLSVQAKLLRAIQEKKIERLGSTKAAEVDVRILAAAKTDLKKKAEAGEFREDLYYRLAVIPIRLPLLRERKDDIPLLIQHFLDKYCLREKRPTLRLTPEAVGILEDYPWPGNVRELENVIERLVILCRGENCGIEFLKKEMTEPFSGTGQGSYVPCMPDGEIDLQAEIQAFERHLIEWAIEKSKGNKSRAAELLRLKRSTLGDRIAKLGIGSAEGGQRPSPKG